MERDELRGTLEALLFAASEPLTLAELRKFLPEVESAEVKAAFEEIRLHYESDDHGVMLAELAGGYQFVTKPAHAGALEEMLRGSRKARLSKAALETLAIIAYKQPITRLGIERIRGVDAGGVLRTLLERDLVTIRGRDVGPGRPLLYGTTADFLSYFGLNALAELPRMEELEALAEAKGAVGTRELASDSIGSQEDDAEAMETIGSEPAAESEEETSAAPVEREESLEREEPVQSEEPPNADRPSIESRLTTHDQSRDRLN